MLVASVALEAPRADLDEGDTAAVVGIHVGVDLEDEAREGRLVGGHLALLGTDGARRRGDLDEAVQQLLHPKVIECRAEEDGS